MGNVLNKYIEVAIEILLFSIIAVIIVVFANYANSAYALKKESDVRIHELKEYRELYKYLNTSVLLGDDIINLISSHPYEFDIVIVPKIGSNIELTATSSYLEWSKETLLNDIRFKTNGNYNVNYSRDIYSGDILVFEFIEQ